MSREHQGTFNKFAWWSIGTIDATAGNADAALGVAERTFQIAKALANVVYYYVNPGISSLDLRAIFATDDEDAVFDVYSGNLTKNPGQKPLVDCALQRLFTITAKAGTQQNVTSTELFADTLTISNDATLSGVGRINPAANHMNTIHWDLKGANIVVIHAHTTVDEDVKIEIKGYS